jgi:hypothetical protein
VDLAASEDALTMLPCSAFVALLCCATPARAQELLDLHLAEDLTSRGVVVLEPASGRDTFVVGESFELALVLAIERTFLEEKLIQLFQRRLELPVQVQAPWLVALEGAELGPFAEPTEGARLALGEELVRARRLADEEREGRAFARFELARPCRATRVGALLLAAPVVRLAYAETFADDFLEGRVPRDRHDALVHGKARALTSLPPPEEGRPLDFSGAIGSFTFLARASRTELALGESVTLELEVTGSGDLSDALAPRLEGLAGLRILGELVEREPTRLVVRYDLAAEAPGTLTIPAQTYATFDLAPPAGYRTLTSAPVTLISNSVSLPLDPRKRGERFETPENLWSRVGTRNWIVAGLLLLSLGAWLVLRRRS